MTEPAVVTPAPGPAPPPAASIDGGSAAPAPSLTPTPVETDDLAVLLAGGYGAVDGFLGPADLDAVRASGRLVDGTPCPVPVALRAPRGTAEAALAAGSLSLLDEEGAPVAVLLVREVWPTGGQPVGGQEWGIAGPVAPHGRSAAPAVTGASGPVLGVAFDRPLYAPAVASVAAAAAARGAGVVLVPLTGRGRPGAMERGALVRSCAGAARALSASVRPMALPHHGDDVRDRAAQVLAAQACGATAVALPQLPAASDPPVVDLPAVGFDGQTRTWNAAAVTVTAPDGVDAQVDALVAAGAPVPEQLADPTVVRELRRSHRPGGGRGFGVLLSGLSGSGKSTIARALLDTLLETTDRTVTLLDGDVVRRTLTAGLGFSRADREQNVRRIGFVAAQIVRHGGIALCAPIAPYTGMRTEMRAMVEEGGGFLLVHVATPLEVCEARDRKGLYARARAGTIPEFTGISDPYEAPTDADLVIDAAQVAVPDAVRRIVAAVADRGWLV